MILGLLCRKLVPMKTAHKILILVVCFALSFPWMATSISVIINEDQHSFCEKIEYTGNEVELEDKTDEIIFHYPSLFELASFSGTLFVEHLHDYNFIVKQSFIEIVSPPPEV